MILRYLVANISTSDKVEQITQNYGAPRDPKLMLECYVSYI